MVLNDILETYPDDELVYIGCKPERIPGLKFGSTGAGFAYIGLAKDVPEEFSRRDVLEVYPRTICDPGTIFIIRGTERGRFWFWYECDPNVPKPDQELTQSTEPFENLLAAIVKSAIAEYTDLFKKVIKKRRPKTPEQLESVIQMCTKQLHEGSASVYSSRVLHDAYIGAYAQDSWNFLAGTDKGEYCMTYALDEIRIDFAHPEIKKMTKPEEQYKAYRKYHKELILNRVRKDDHKHYATIKGRSVKHE